MMQSTTHQTSYPDRTREQGLSSTPVVSSEEPEISHSTQDPVSDQPWEPKFDRRQSWSHQDRKHELQERLLGVQEGTETGFSEEGHEHKCI